MRIIAGRFAGIPLQAPRSGTRPTTDRTKEALFSHLDAEGILVPGSSVLDLFAGTGALGFEALSRGADRAVLVDRSPQAVALLKKAASRVRAHGSWDASAMSIRVLRSSADAAVDRLAVLRQDAENPDSGGPFSVVFLDPPYAMESDELAGLIATIVARGLIAEDGEFVIERSTRSQPVALPTGWEAGKSKRYGETTLTYAYRA